MGVRATGESPAKLALPMGRVISFATITAFGFVLGQASGVIREMVVGAQFGLSAEIDAYKLAYLIPTFANNIVAGSAISAAAMPVFARYLASGRRSEFWRVASVVTNIVLLVTGVLTVLGMVFAGPIISIVGAGFKAPTQSIAATLVVIMMPTLFLGAMLNMAMAMLNSLDRFVGPAMIYLALNAGIIGAVVLLAPTFGIYAVGIGFLLGVALQVLVQSFELRRERAHWTPVLDLKHPALREVLVIFLPITAGAIVSQINLVVDGAMAAWLPTGSVGALSYANTILGAFYSLGISLSIAVFPSLSRMAAADDAEGASRAVTLALRLLIFILMPLTVLLIAFPVPVVGLILQRGQFDAAAVQLTVNALTMFGVGLVAVGAMYVMQKAFYAVSDGKTPLFVGACVVVVHVALNLLLLPSMAHAGIALSSSIATALGVVILAALYARRRNGFRLVPLGSLLVQCAILAIASTLAAWGLAQILQIGTTSLVERLITIGIAGLGGILYLVLAWLVKIPELQMLLDWAVRIRMRLMQRAA